MDDGLEVLHVIGRLVVDLPLEPLHGRHHLLVGLLLHLLVLGEGVEDLLQRVGERHVAGQDEDGALRRDDVWRDPAVGVCVWVSDHGPLQVEEAREEVLAVLTRALSLLKL